MSMKTPLCPMRSCHAHMTLRAGKRGAFWGCNRYPHCQGQRRIPDNLDRIADAWHLPSPPHQDTG